MIKMTKTQETFLDELYNRYGDLMRVTTHQIATDRGDRQNYETYITQRLFRLAKIGLVSYVEKKSERGNVLRREWSWTDRGALMML